MSFRCKGDGFLLSGMWYRAGSLRDPLGVCGMSGQQRCGQPCLTHSEDSSQAVTIPPKGSQPQSSNRLSSPLPNFLRCSSQFSPNLHVFPLGNIPPQGLLVPYPVGARACGMALDSHCRSPLSFPLQHITNQNSSSCGTFCKYHIPDLLLSLLLGAGSLCPACLGRHSVQ